MTIPSSPWAELLEEVRASCLAQGTWSGEARRLRDALDAKRMTASLGAQIEARLRSAGYELDEIPRFESDPVIVAPAGTRDLAAELAPLLPELRALDRVVPVGLPWRDSLIATRCVGRALARRMAGDASR